MTGSYRLSGPNTVLTQIGRWLTLAGLAVAGAFMLFFSAAFALILLGTIALIAFAAVAALWIKAKVTGKPFGPKAHMDELRRQMEAAGFDASRQSAASNDGPVIEARETPEGWTVER